MLASLFTNAAVTTILVVSAYATVSLLFWIRAKRAQRQSDEKLELGMLSLSLLFLVLALSYQLELIPKGIALAKSAAKNSGWYAYRWPLSGLGVMTITAAVGFCALRFRGKFRGWRYPEFIVAFGAALFMSYFLLRATSLHWVDPWLGIHFGCPRTNPWIELMSASCVASGLALAGFCKARGESEGRCDPAKAVLNKATSQSKTCCG